MVAGVGLIISTEEGSGRILITGVVEGGAAAKSGLIQAGDMLLAVDGVSLAGIELPRIHQTFFAGDDDTPIDLHIQRGEEETKIVSLRRQPLEVAGRSLVSNSVAVEGFLNKMKDGLMKRSMKRWFVLTNSMLSYQEERAIQVPLAEIDLTHISNVQKLDHLSFSFFCTFVTFRDRKIKSNRTFRVSADSDAEAKKWFDALVERTRHDWQTKMLLNSGNGTELTTTTSTTPPAAAAQ